MSAVDCAQYVKVHVQENAEGGCFGVGEDQPLAADPLLQDRLAWLRVVEQGLAHRPYLLTASQNGRVAGVLPLALVQSRMFGRFLVSLPYVNSAGVLADEENAAAALIDRAVQLAIELNVRYLELRHERELPHPGFTHTMASKVHMRMALPDSAEELFKWFKPSVRNQIRKGEKQGLTVRWGSDERLKDFYRVFSRNMRDLGTPVYGRRLFRSILEQFGEAAELCVVYRQEQPIAGALLVHGRQGTTEVPSASSLRKFNSTNANMLMYWHLLMRTIERGQQVFDFGRSSKDSSTFRFKKQWGARPDPAVWQYFVREGAVSDMRPENDKYQRLINLWKRLPVPLTQWIGPRIVRGIP